jgi:heme-degrading monooxygenase HmoA
VISRHWTGIVKPGMSAAYIQHLQRETLPQLSRINGFISASILERPVNPGTEFRVVTCWESIDAIAAFAGEDPETAVVPPIAQAMMSSFERRATHYQVVALASNAGATRST